MQPNRQKVKDDSIKEMDRLILTIQSNNPTLTEEKLAHDLGYNEGYISQCRSRNSVSEKFLKTLRRHRNSTVHHVASQGKPAEPKKEQAPIETQDILKGLGDQPIIQVVLNLTYIGKKNADSIDTMSKGVNTMAATNQRNTEIIAALVNAIVPNSGLADKLSASLADSHADDDLPAEAFLNEAGIEFLRKQMQAGKKKPVHK